MHDTADNTHKSVAVALRKQQELSNYRYELLLIAS